MKRLRLSIATLSGVVCALSFSVATALAQSQVLVETHPIDTTSSICGGAVTQRVNGTIVSIARFDANGDLISVANVFADYKTTFTNPQTGESLTSVRGALERRTIYEDGSFTRITAGLFGEVVVPGTGVVAMNTGFLSVSFDSSGALVDLFVTPTRDGQINPFVCEALA